jgi:hypothetical protein
VSHAQREVFLSVFENQVSPAVIIMMYLPVSVGDDLHRDGCFKFIGPLDRSTCIVMSGDTS